MPDDSKTHDPSLTSRQGEALEQMMAYVRVPPFEEFYGEHRERVYRLLVRSLGVERAEDAFQETFLRALRAYGNLRHGEQLGAWVATIAEHVAIDVHRRPRPTADEVDEDGWDARPAYAELEHLAGRLPATERAAVVLRYGYDLDYDQIGAVLGSNAVAARQAASAGVRRLRKELA
jgi:RNA polymerase sigma factor (sigma-70 family)